MSVGIPIYKAYSPSQHELKQKQDQHKKSGNILWEYPLLQKAQREDCRKSELGLEDKEKVKAGLKKQVKNIFLSITKKKV